MTLPHFAIWLIDPISQHSVFSLDIFDKNDRSRFLEREKWLRTHGFPELVRVAATSLNEVRIIGNEEEIPVPLPPRAIRPGTCAEYAKFPEG